MRFDVLLNTFDRAHFLPRVLHAWTRVTGPRFRIVVADDGSGDGTTELLRELGPALPYPLVHVRHENRGHRRAEILNKGVWHCEEEAILFTDADSLPQRDLLEVHARHHTSRRLLVGGYLRLDEAYSADLDLEATLRGEYEARCTPEARKKLRAQHRKHRLYCWLRKKGRPHVMGLNMVIPRSGFVAVNGYDNEYRGWGRADGDLRERLKRVGVRPHSDWDEAIVYHLWHPEDATKKEQRNVARSERRRVPIRPEHGFAEIAEEARSSVVYRNPAAGGD